MKGKKITSKKHDFDAAAKAIVMAQAGFMSAVHKAKAKFESETSVSEKKLRAEYEKAARKAGFKNYLALAGAMHYAKPNVAIAIPDAPRVVVKRPRVSAAPKAEAQDAATFERRLSELSALASR